MIGIRVTVYFILFIYFITRYRKTVHNIFVTKQEVEYRFTDLNDFLICRKNQNSQLLFPKHIIPTRP